jgi:hypothetical protein
MALQEELRGRVVTEDRFGALCRVAGIDVGFDRRGREARARAAATVEVTFLAVPLELRRLDFLRARESDVVAPEGRPHDRSVEA